ncbi:hypothetical protein [Aureimonas flava]|nr:hypothetical protein [Aureimonas flava]
MGSLEAALEALLIVVCRVLCRRMIRRILTDPRAEIGREPALAQAIRPFQ